MPRHVAPRVALNAARHRVLGCRLRQIGLTQGRQASSVSAVLPFSLCNSPQGAAPVATDCGCNDTLMQSERLRHAGPDVLKTNSDPFTPPGYDDEGSATYHPCSGFHSWSRLNLSRRAKKVHALQWGPTAPLDTAPAPPRRAPPRRGLCSPSLSLFMAPIAINIASRSAIALHRPPLVAIHHRLRCRCRPAPPRQAVPRCSAPSPSPLWAFAKDPWSLYAYRSPF